MLSFHHNPLIHLMILCIAVSNGITITLLLVLLLLSLHAAVVFTCIARSCTLRKNLLDHDDNRFIGITFKLDPPFSRSNDKVF